MGLNVKNGWLGTSSLLAIARQSNTVSAPWIPAHRTEACSQLAGGLSTDCGVVKFPPEIPFFFRFDDSCPAGPPIDSTSSPGGHYGAVRDGVLAHRDRVIDDSKRVRLSGLSALRVSCGMHHALDGSFSQFERELSINLKRYTDLERIEIYRTSRQTKNYR